MLEQAVFHEDKMRAAASGGFINATDCADYLTKKGVPFRDAYKISGELVRTCIEKGETLETLPLEQYKAVCGVFEQDVYDAVDLINCVSLRSSYGGPAPSAVTTQIAHAREALAKV